MILLGLWNGTPDQNLRGLLNSPFYSKLISSLALAGSNMQLQAFLGLMLIVCFISPANAEATHNYFKKKHAVFVGIFEQSSSGTILAQRGSLEPAYVEFEEVGIATDHTSWMVEYRYHL